MSIEVTPELLATIIFLITYAGIALGRIPGLMLDRTGVALLGAIAMLSTGVLNENEAFQAIHLPASETCQCRLHPMSLLWLRTGITLSKANS